MEFVAYEKKGYIFHLIIDRPAIMNAINSQTMTEITDVLGVNTLIE